MHEQEVSCQGYRDPNEDIFPILTQRWPWRLRTRKNLPEGSARTPKEREFLPDGRGGV